jgi:hypothetical protein
LNLQRETADCGQTGELAASAGGAEEIIRWTLSFSLETARREEAITVCA